jgi:hypothetical protein
VDHVSFRRMMAVIAIAIAIAITTRVVDETVVHI